MATIIVTVLSLLIAGILMANLSDALALAWHQESKVFTKKSFHETLSLMKKRGPAWCLQKAFLGRRRKLWVFLVESLYCGILLSAFYGAYGFSVDFWLFSFVLFAFAVALVSDVRWREIPHEINYAVFAIAVASVILGGKTVFGFLLGILPAFLLLAVGLVVFAICPSKGFGIGGGDLRFVFSMGALMGLSFAVMLVFLGCAASLLLNIPLLIKDLRKRESSCVPMMIGFSLAFVAMLYGHYLAPAERDLFPILSFF